MARTPDPSEAELIGRVFEPRPATAEPGRHRARRSAMMLLYRADVMGRELTTPAIEQEIEQFSAEHGFPLPRYSQQLARGVAAEQPLVDAQLQTHLTDWRLDRLGAVERAVLRIAMWELTTGEVPAPVAIDEAVELAKRYATPEAAQLINGVLAGWLRAQPTRTHEDDDAQEQSDEQ